MASCGLDRTYGTFPSDSKGSSGVFNRKSLWDSFCWVFLPGADGKRACPGKEFVQVELVGAWSALSAGEWRVEPVRETPEEREEAATAAVSHYLVAEPILWFVIEHSAMDTCWWAATANLINHRSSVEGNRKW